MSMLMISRIRNLLAVLLVTAMMGGGMLSPAGVVAQVQSVQSQLTGATITYGPPYQLQADLGYADENLEMIVLLGAADMLSIGFMSPLVDLNGARDIILEALFGEGVVAASIDRGDYPAVSYSLDMMNIDGSEMGVFSLFMNNRSHGFAEFYIFIAPPALFASTMQTAQNSITIAGTPVMDGVDATVMGNMVAANVGITGGTAVTNVTDVTNQTTTTVPTQPAQPTQTTQTTQTTQPDANARATYLAAVQAEFETANTALTDFVSAFDAFTQQTKTADEVRPIINSTMQTLAGTSQRAGAIQPPAGMETFHQEFLAWAQAMTNVGVAWANFNNGTATADDHRLALLDAIDAHTAFAESLDAELNATSQAPQQPAQPTQTTQTTQPVSGDREAYLAAVQAEYDTATAELATILGTLEAMSNETMPAAEAVPILDTAHQSLSGTSGRAAAIQPPAGMEAFHQEFLAWAQTMTDLGLGWAAGVASGNLDAYSPLFDAALESHTNFAISLETELANTGGQTTVQPTAATTTTTTTPTRTTRTTTAETPAPTEATTTTGTTGDGRAEYLQAVRAEYDYVDEQVLLILDALDGLENETLTAEEAVAQMTTANAELSASAQRIEGLSAPAGMEDFHQQFLEWNAAVVDAGDTWQQFISQQVEVDAYIDALNVLVPVHTAFGVALETEETAGSQSTSETPTATEASGTTRTTRTTRSSTNTPQGNTSETGGNTGATTALAGGNEWLMPENNVTVTWTEPFVPNESDGSATESDPATGEDSIRLIWESTTGTTSRLTISVTPSDSGDASGLVSMLEADELAAAELFGEGAVLVNSVNDPNASAALIQLNIPQADLWIYVQYTCLDTSCTSTAMLLVVSGRENLPLLLADMEQGVSVDGVVISNAMSVPDIENSLSTPGN